MKKLRQNELSRFTKAGFQQCRYLSVVPGSLIYAFLRVSTLNRDSRVSDKICFSIDIPSLKDKLKLLEASV